MVLQPFLDSVSVRNGGEVAKERLYSVNSTCVFPAPVPKAGEVRFHGLFAGSGHSG